MEIGTAGFTAAMSVAALEARGLGPGDGPVLVTGASGGVGSAAVAILATRGHEVWAATGKADEADRLTLLGAAGILTREDVTAPGRPLERVRWAGAVDTVGAATLPYVLRTLRIGAAVASSGNASGAELVTTVFPFILRGVALLGMDSANMAIEPRRALWSRLATDLLPRGIDDGITEVDLESLEPALDAIVAGAGARPLGRARRRLTSAADRGNQARSPRSCANARPRGSSICAGGYGPSARAASSSMNPPWTSDRPGHHLSQLLQGPPPRTGARRGPRAPARPRCEGPVIARSASTVAGQSIGNPSPK